MASDYKPRPIPTAGLSLSDDVLALSELLARNAHDRWAEQRMAEGWRYGEQRNDERKEHPCLVPYDELPESEKAYDRKVAIETLKAVVAMGYLLQPPAAADARRAVAQPPTAPLEEPGDTMRRLGLPGLWSSDELGASTEDVYRQVAERALQVGKPLLAYDVLEQALKMRPGSARLRQMQALALLRGGATERANVLLGELDREGVADEETLGLLARTHKDMGLAADQPARRRAQLARAHEVYQRAFRQTGGYWTGINAATLARVIGLDDVAADLAREVRALCLGEMQKTSARTEDRYWLLATLAEAALVLGNASEAVDWYERAGELGRGRFGDLSSTRRNARLLIEHLGIDAAPIERALRLPRVVVFSGHMIDTPGRSPRFPPELEGAVKRALRERLERLDARLGFAAGACGGDILFLESIVELGGEANLVLPYGRERFVVDSVECVPGAWGRRFERLVDVAAQVVTASPEKLEGATTSYEYGALLLLGLASIRAEQLDTELVPLVLWDNGPGEPGGTASTIERWRALGHEVEIVDVRELLHRQRPELTNVSVEAPPAHPANVPNAPDIMAILFADAVHFSKMTERQIPLFVEHFLGAIAKLLARAPRPPVVRNTWGDGLYFVFSGIEEAGAFALDLSELADRTDWAAIGLPRDLNLRVALHAGPVYSCVDPVTGQVNYIGSHVSRGARIEPITPPGNVYASQAFAALAAAQHARGFTCEYAGQTLWAKGYGTFPTYHVRRRDHREREPRRQVG